MEKVRLVQSTPKPEETMAYIARVSNPNNQDNPSFEGLLKYCINHGHWSVFEQAYMTLEIETSRAIAAQVLRHRSFTFQEFSQRYADSSMLASSIPVPELRGQDYKNRQNSLDNVDAFKRQTFEIAIQKYFTEGMDLYQTMLDAGIAKECARMVLPLATPTKIYMTGSCRSWVHYIDLRSAHGTQKEHMDIAVQAKSIFCEQYPTVGKALEWS